jgi:hypothetical protein
MAEFIDLHMKNLLGNLYAGRIQIRETKQGTSYYAIGLGHKASAKLYSFLYANATIYMERKLQKFLLGIHCNDY